LWSDSRVQPILLIVELDHSFANHNAILTDQGYDRADSLKVDPKGREPEVLEGAPLDIIDKVVVDYTPEREKESTVDAV
jgi:hypothetical protein